MLGLSTFGGDVYGLPFSISLPVGYYNEDLMKEAGITSQPKTWDEVVAACKKMHAKGIKTQCSGAGTLQGTGSCRP